MGGGGCVGGGGARVKLDKSKQIQENTSQFQNKSSNPHSEFIGFDVHIFI